MKKVLSEEEYQEVEEALEKLFFAEPGTEGAKKFRELVKLVKQHHVNLDYQNIGQTADSIPPPPQKLNLNRIFDAASPPAERN